jgi:hypothetical protein
MGGADAPPQENFVLDPNGAFIDGKMAVNFCSRQNVIFRAE